MDKNTVDRLHWPSLSRHHKTRTVSDSFTKNADAYTLVCYATVTTYWFISALNLVTNGKMGQNLANIYQEIVPSDKWWKVMKAALTGPCFFQFKCNYLHS